MPDSGSSRSSHSRAGDSTATAISGARQSGRCPPLPRMKPRGSRTMTSHLEKTVNIKGVKAGLLREFLSKEEFADPERLAISIKHLAVPLIAPSPLDEAISSAGGVRFESLDESLMVRSRPGVFCAGEMLDWEASTGGYLLTACFASGYAAGRGVLSWLEGQRRRSG